MLQMRRTAEAIELFRSAALGFAADGSIRKALAMYERVLALDPEDAGAALGAARAFRAVGLVSDAFDRYRRAIGLLRARGDMDAVHATVLESDEMMGQSSRGVDIKKPLRDDQAVTFVVDFDL